METSASTLQDPSVQFRQTKSARGSKQQHQRVFLPVHCRLPRSAFQPAQGKSRRWDLVDQVDECNLKIEELLRKGEATISPSSLDASPVSKKSCAETEEGDSLNKSSEEASWEDLDLVADTVLRSLGEQLNGSREHSSCWRSNSSSSLESTAQDECAFDSALKQSGSNGTLSTGLSTGSTLDEEDGVEVKTLDCVDDEQLSVDRQCVTGHDLAPHRTPSNMWWCSKCLKQVEKGTRLFGCRRCNYDECWSCLRASQSMITARCDDAICTPSTEGLASDLVASLQQQVTHLQEVASLQRQVSDLRDQLHEVMHERDMEIAKYRRHQATIACSILETAKNHTTSSQPGRARSLGRAPRS